MASRRLLISFAHPDDESFGLGALIARYVAEGVEVSLICATNGDVGTVSPEMMNGYTSIAELRLAELDCAAQKLGLKHVFKLGYRDSGMMNSETSNDPACLWQAPRDEVTRRVTDVIREVRPQVIITFNRYGGYGHPDHIAIQRATVEAFRQAQDPTYVTARPAYEPQKLYYGTFPTILLRYRILRVRMRGEDPRKVGRNKDIDLQAILDHVEPAHARVDIRSYLKAWDDASACHASQMTGRGPQLPMFARKLLLSHQSFTRVYPAPRYNRVDEYDLFAGVHLDDRVIAR